MGKMMGIVTVMLIGYIGMAVATPQVGGGDGSTWEAPPDARAKKNPIPANPEVATQGKTLYTRHCAACHGPTGKGDGPGAQLFKPPPADISTPEKQAALTDGEIFWKITVGRNRMPPFEKTLSEEERWVIVHFVRTLKTG